LRFVICPCEYYSIARSRGCSLASPLPPSLSPSLLFPHLARRAHEDRPRRPPSSVLLLLLLLRQ
jgi:hypothetical protein